MVKKISRQDGSEGPTDEARDRPEETSGLPNATTSGSEDEKAGERLDQDERGFEEKKAASPGPSGA